uniref:Uncharacterized protein n=1 Tax=Avena sativa TaxID=4498 RepID=A0ACD5Z7F5_AVESA
MGAEWLLLGASSGKVSAAAASTALAARSVGTVASLQHGRRLGPVKLAALRQRGCAWRWQHRKDGDLSQKFWSTKDRGQRQFTFTIGLGSVIKGWDEGVLTMQVGEVARITCTPAYGYGASGFPLWGILPNSMLVFEIEVLSTK